MNERIMDLIEGAVADTLSPAEVTELDAISSSDPEVAQEVKSAFEDLLFASAIVDAQSESAVPAGFSDRVMEALPARAAWEPAPERRKKFVFRTKGTSLRSFIFGAGAWAIAAVFVLFMFTDGEIQQDTSMSGSMAQPPEVTTSFGADDVTIDLMQGPEGASLYVANRLQDDIDIIVSGATLADDAPTNAGIADEGISIRQSRVTESIIPIVVSDVDALSFRVSADGTLLFRSPRE